MNAGGATVGGAAKDVKDAGQDVARKRVRVGPPPARGRPWGVVGFGAVVVVAALVRAFVLQPYVVPSGSMEPLLRPGNRILISPLPSVERGDVVVFRAPGWTVGRAAGDVYVKRVIGLPGDRVRCCATDGRIELNGSALTEPYLEPSERPSTATFDVRVPAGRVWVMGDHRSASSDSRAHLDPGGNAHAPTIAVDDIRGQVLAVAWPPQDATALR